jgi:hypothetical protein
VSLRSGVVEHAIVAKALNLAAQEIVSFVVDHFSSLIITAIYWIAPNMFNNY